MWQWFNGLPKRIFKRKQDISLPNMFEPKKVRNRVFLAHKMEDIGSTTNYICIDSIIPIYAASLIFWFFTDREAVFCWYQVIQKYNFPENAIFCDSLACKPRISTYRGRQAMQPASTFSPGLYHIHVHCTLHALLYIIFWYPWNETRQQQNQCRTSPLYNISARKALKCLHFFVSTESV